MVLFIKRFTEWIGLKEKLDAGKKKAPLFKEGEIWWCALGENIGIEISGKSKYFSRPVYVFKKLSQDGFLGIPMTTQKKKGSWYVPVKQEGKDVVVIIGQARTLSSKRLHSKIGHLDDSDKEKVLRGFEELFLKSFPPRISEESWENPKYKFIIANSSGVSSEMANIDKSILDKVNIGQKWRHYKGKIYEIVYITTHSETDEVLIVYKRLDDGCTHARPIDLFFGNVFVDGVEVPRFTLYNE